MKLGNKATNLLYIFSDTNAALSKISSCWGPTTGPAPYGVTGAAMDDPLFGPPSKKMVITSSLDMCVPQTVHVNIVMASAVLALNAILITDTKKEGVVFWTHSPNTN